MYNIKIYSRNGNYKTTLIDKVKNEISFSVQANGGASNIDLDLNVALDWDGIDMTDIVQIVKDGKVIFIGMCDRIQKYSKGYSEGITITILGLAYLLKIRFASLGNYGSGNIGYVGNVLTSPRNGIIDTINNLNSSFLGFNWLQYDTFTMPEYVGTNNISIKYENASQFFGKMSNMMGRKWAISGDGRVFCKPKSESPTHTLTFQKEIIEIVAENNIESLKNSLITLWTQVNTYTNENGSYTVEAELEKVLQNTESMSMYGARHLVYDSQIKSENDHLVNIYANQKFLELQSNQKKYSVVIDNSKLKNEIQILDTISVRNSKIEIENMQVVRISYKEDFTTLDLEGFDSIAKELI